MEELPLKLGELKEQTGDEFVAEVLQDAQIGPGDYVLVDAAAPLYVLAQVELTSKAQKSVRLGELGTIAIPVRRIRGRLLSPVKWDPSSTFGEVPTAPGLQEVIKGELRGDVLAPPVKLLQAAFTDAIKDSKIPLQIGELRLPTENVRVILDGGKMNRHSCLLAQSGSGKSFALGVLVEELLVKSDAQVIVLDPNGDFRNFLIPKVLDETDRDTKTHPDFPVNTSRNKCQPISKPDHDQFIETINSLRKVIVGCTEDAQYDLLLDFGQLTTAEKAILLDLDEPQMLLAWNELESILGSGFTLQQLRDACDTLIEKQRDTTDGLRMAPFLALRLRVEQVESMAIWAAASTRHTYLDCLGSHEIAFVSLCLEGLRYFERAVLVGKGLELLWKRQEKGRHPTFLVVDEAHNFAPVEPSNAFERKTLDLMIRIAGEGRKYGLFQIVVSQRPSKIHPTVLNGCHNFFVMRMTNRADIRAVEDAFTGVSKHLLQIVPLFAQGDALILGPVAKWPLLIRFGRRRMREGGQDIKIKPRPVAPI